MKVQNIKNMDPGIAPARGLESKSESGAQAVLFKQAISSMSREQIHARLEELMRNIDSQAEKLTKRADIKEFEKYRSLIRDFMNEVVSNGYSFAKENTFESRGRHRVMATVKKIDDKLEDLAKDMLEGQSEGIDIINKIDDIRGLLVDLML